ncbi:hypothetical protein Q5752_005321 [Cryptotrichosporon argae]
MPDVRARIEDLLGRADEGDDRAGDTSSVDVNLAEALPPCVPLRPADARSANAKTVKRTTDRSPMITFPWVFYEEIIELPNVKPKDETESASPTEPSRNRTRATSRKTEKLRATPEPSATLGHWHIT